MLPYTLNNIDAAVLEEICRQQFAESGTLDFKRSIPGRDGGGTFEIAKDVSAFANADGGDLVYGIDEKDGVAASMTPIVGESADDAERRLRQVIDASIEPRLAVQMKAVEVGDGYVLILRVARSFDGPHCVRKDNQRRFALRNGTSTSDMSYDQIRTAFGRTATLGEQARNFFASRVEAIEQEKTWRPMEPGRPIAVFDFVPLSGLAGRVSIDMGAIDFSKFITWEDGGGSPAVNLDGVVAHYGSDEGLWGLTQTYRNGCVESIVVVGGTGRDGRAGVWRDRAERFYIRSLERCFNAAQKWALAGPAVVQCALLNVADCALETGSPHDYISRKTADRPHLVFPEVWIEDISTPFVASDVLSETHSVLTQSFGFMPRRRRS